MFSFKDFSMHLISSGDLDPDYIFINNVCESKGWGLEEKAKWVAVKSIIYDSISELEFIIYNKSFDELKYGTERRKHKRNVESFWAAIEEKRKEHGSYLAFFESLPTDATLAMVELKKIRGVGPWAAWKIIDLINCCLGKEFDFSNLDFRVAYEYPIRGLLLVSGEDENDHKNIEDELYNKIIEKTISGLGSVNTLLAPPRKERKINIQEIETCLCKYHSYYHNHYYLGHDIDRLHKRIEESNYEEIRRLKCHLPKKLTLWGQDLQVAY